MNTTAYATRPEETVPNAGSWTPQATSETLYILAQSPELGSEGSLIDRDSRQCVQLEVGQVAIWSTGHDRQSEIYRTRDGDLSMLTRDTDGNWPEEVVTRLEDIRDRVQAQDQKQQPNTVAPFSSLDVEGEVIFDSWDQPQAETGNSPGLLQRVTRTANYLKSLVFGYEGKRRRAPESRTDQSRPQGEQHRAKNHPHGRRDSRQHTGQHRR